MYGYKSILLVVEIRVGSRSIVSVVDSMLVKITITHTTTTYQIDNALLHSNHKWVRRMIQYIDELDMVLIHNLPEIEDRIGSE